MKLHCASVPPPCLVCLSCILSHLPVPPPCLVCLSRQPVSSARLAILSRLPVPPPSLVCLSCHTVSSACPATLSSACPTTMSCLPVPSPCLVCLSRSATLSSRLPRFPIHGFFHFSGFPVPSTRSLLPACPVCFFSLSISRPFCCSSCLSYCLKQDRLLGFPPNYPQIKYRD
jgi:hypothetical protein